MAGVTPGLVVTDRDGWTPASRYADGSALPELLDAATRHWSAPRHVAAALLWKQYTYWLLLPAVLGYALGRVPLLTAGNVLVQPHKGGAFLRLGLAEARVAPDLVPGVLDEHLTPMLGHLRELAHVGRRTLLGSVASAVCYALIRNRDAVPGDVNATAIELLDALGVADLVDLTPDLRVRRRTCCLAFALPQPKICDGCCIRFS